MRRLLGTTTVACAILLAAAAVVARQVGAVPAPPGPALSPPWVNVATGTTGSSLWSGVIPNPYDTHERASAVYLPPGFTTARHYPVLYLLHGLRGSPSSYTSGLHLQKVVDGMIAAGQVAPMIIVVPAGANSNSAEWAGMWDSYVSARVVPWVDSHLPTIPTRAARVLGGLCAGGYGAMDIGLRHPMFGALESWDGYFAPVFHDGPFAHATQSFLRANDPTLLVTQHAASLRRAGVRFYVSVGGNHGAVLRQWSLDFAELLDRVGLRHTLWQLPAADRGHFWGATLPSALRFASDAFGAASSAEVAS